MYQRCYSVGNVYADDMHTCRLLVDCGIGKSGPLAYILEYFIETVKLYILGSISVHGREISKSFFHVPAAWIVTVAVIGVRESTALFIRKALHEYSQSFVTLLALLADDSESRPHSPAPYVHMH